MVGAIKKAIPPRRVSSLVHYPAHAVMSPSRAASKDAKDAGQGAPLTRSLPAAELVATLVRELRAAWQRDKPL